MVLAVELESAPVAASCMEGRPNQAGAASVSRKVVHVDKFLCSCRCTVLWFKVCVGSFGMCSLCAWMQVEAGFGFVVTDLLSLVTAQGT